MNRMKKALPYIVFALAFMIVAQFYMKNSRVRGGQEGYDYDALARAVVMDDGRAKPLDTVARNAMLVIQGKQYFVTRDDEKMDAIVWFIDAIARPDVAAEYQVFQVYHPDVIELAGLRPEDGYDGKHFSYNQLLPARSVVLSSSSVLSEKEALTPYDSALLKLAGQLVLYEDLTQARRPLPIPPSPGTEGATWAGFDRLPAQFAFANPQSTVMDILAVSVVVKVVRDEQLSPAEIPAFFDERVQEKQFPPVFYSMAVLYSAYASGPEAWEGAVARITGNDAHGEARASYDRLALVFADFENDLSIWNVLRTMGLPELNAPMQIWREMAEAYQAQDAAAFNAALASREALLKTNGIEGTDKARFEVAFNRFMPFVQAQVLDILAFLLAMGVLWFGKSEKGTWGRAIWWSMMVVLVMALAVHTFGMFARVYIQGRPPVTNLYSSAVLVGWAAAGVCLLIEWITKRGVGGIVAAVFGFTTLIIAHHLHLQDGGDTMGPMQAVLDSNFWLATHVVAVSMGYSATFVAGNLALVYIIKGMCTPKLDRTEARQITQMVYGTVCFALLLSFVGTVLGGIWADQSWGRFWGWDPKENGAVMVVIMNAIILHAKWGKLVKERGLMVLAVSGNIITAWSWFGTNQLGVGLHSYGFTDGTVMWLAIFGGSQVLVMGVALYVPTSYWWSFYRQGRTSTSMDTSGSRWCLGPSHIIPFTLILSSILILLAKNLIIKLLNDPQANESLSDSLAAANRAAGLAGEIYVVSGLLMALGIVLLIRLFLFPPRSRT